MALKRVNNMVQFSDSFIEEFLRDMRSAPEMSVGNFFKFLVSSDYIPHESLVKLVSSNNLSEQIFEAVSLHAMQSYPHGYITDYYCSDLDLCCALASNPSTPEPILRALHSLDEEHVNVSLAGNPTTPSDVLFEHLRWDSNDCQYALYRNPVVPAYILEFVYDNDYNAFFKSIANNPNTPYRVLKGLLEDDKRFWYDLACNPRIETEFLHHMVDRYDPALGEGFLKKIASNPNADEMILMNLVMQYPFVRIDVALNPSSTAKVLTFLGNIHGVPDGKSFRSSSMEDVDLVRSYVARNHNTPMDILKTLCKDEVQPVAYNAIANPVLRPLIDCPEHVAVIKKYLSGISGRLDASMNHDTPSNILIDLVQSGFCLREISQNPNLPEECLPQLLKSNDLSVILNVLSHSKMQSYMKMTFAELDEHFNNSSMQQKSIIERKKAKFNKISR